MSHFINKLPDDILKKREYLRDEDVRGVYFRDITALIHSYPFRRLKHKTQVFFSPKNDHICTRMEHSMHVATIAATIAKALYLDPELCWAIGLGHDFGHPPFGHSGEKILSCLLNDKKDFSHEEYSYRVVTKLTAYGKGLNLTYAVNDGIINHCGEKFEQSITPDHQFKDLNNHTVTMYPSTYEGCIVRMSDKIAYVGRDLEDAIALKIVDKKDVPSSVISAVGYKNSSIIDYLVNDLIKTSSKSSSIEFSDSMYEIFTDLIAFNYSAIYTNPKVRQFESYFQKILESLHNYLMNITMQYGQNYSEYNKEKNFLATRYSEFLLKMKNFYESDISVFAPYFDYLAGMTDDYALECIAEITLPKRFGFEHLEY